MGDLIIVDFNKRVVQSGPDALGSQRSPTAFESAGWASKKEELIRMMTSLAKMRISGVSIPGAVESFENTIQAGLEELSEVQLAELSADVRLAEIRQHI